MEAGQNPTSLFFSLQVGLLLSKGHFCELGKLPPCWAVVVTLWAVRGDHKATPGLPPRQASMATLTTHLTLSFGNRLMVLRGRSTRRTRRDLMVLMSFPLLLPLWREGTLGWKEGKKDSGRQAWGSRGERPIAPRDHTLQGLGGLEQPWA